jgi:hypothetical protein
MVTNFILFHKGNTLPLYIYDCIKQIHNTQSNYNLFLLTDASPINIEGATLINLDNIWPLELQDVCFYQSDSNPLWRTSFERFFFIKNFIQKNNIQNAVHFDNDVLIYKNVADIINLLSLNIKNIGLTPHKIDELVCGFMYIKNFNSIELLCSKLLDLAKKGEKALEVELKSMPHEMRLLGNIWQENKDLITMLPVLPFEPWNNQYNVLNGLFDPSSYGQFIGGTHANAGADKLTVHPVNLSRIIDPYIINNNIKVQFNHTTKKPYIMYDDLAIPLFNLHVHSKQLNLYI